MLLFKVIFSLFLFQTYCVGHYIQQNNLFSVHPEEEETTDGVFTTKPDEVQTTDSPSTEGNTTTKPDEITTTESPVCPKDKSLYSKKDIEDIIDFVYAGLGLDEATIEQIVPQATNIKQILSDNLNQFETWFKSQPEHLKHVLQGLSKVRKQQIEPEAQKMAAVLKDYPEVKGQIDEKKSKLSQISKRLKKYENLCKYNCEDQDLEPHTVFKRSVPEEQLCSSIADLYNQITTGLTKKFEVFLNKTKDNLATVETTLTKEIENVKTELKEKALRDFGRTMYDVLTLEDEYHHFVNDMNATNAQVLMYTVKDVGLQIDSKLLELHRLVEAYGDYCRSCNTGRVKRLVRQTNLDMKTKASIVDDLIEQKYNESESKINEIIQETFKDLNKIINDSEWKEMFFNNLKVIQKEIVEAENDERQHLEALKSIAPQDSLKKLTDLASVSQNILNIIDDMISHLKK